MTTDKEKLYERGIFDNPLEELWKVYQHKETDYRVAFLYAFDTPAARSNRRLVRRLKNAVKYIDYNRMITFTYRPSALPVFTKHIGRTMHRIRDWFRIGKIFSQKNFYYFYRFELGEESGRPHWHALVKAPYIQQKRMKKWWPHGFIKIRKVKDTAHALAYISKYMSKPMTKSVDYDLSGVKRGWGCASGITPKAPPSDWELYRIALECDVDELVLNHNTTVERKTQQKHNDADSFIPDIPLIDSRTSNGKVFIRPRVIT